MPSFTRAWHRVLRIPHCLMPGFIRCVANRNTPTITPGQTFTPKPRENQAKRCAVCSLLGAIRPSPVPSIRPSSTTWLLNTADHPLSYRRFAFGTQPTPTMQCWCSDSSRYRTEESSGCTFDCAGDRDQTCGGRYAMSVYQLD